VAVAEEKKLKLGKGTAFDKGHQSCHGSAFAGYHAATWPRRQYRRDLTVWRSMLKVAAATAVFGLAHSALASRTAKRAAAWTFGERDRNGLYRVFYIAQSFVTFGLLVAYIRRQPSRELYRIEGPAALVMHAIQAGAVVYATSAAGQVGIRRILGLESLVAWLGDGPVPPEPQAQGPALDAKDDAMPSARSPGAATRSTSPRCRSSGSGPG
jgi:hypothetical protein